MCYHVLQPAVPPAFSSRLGRRSGPLTRQSERCRASITYFLPGVQRVLTHAVEKDVHASAIAAARPDDIMRAFLYSCDGRWARTSRAPMAAARQ